MALSLLKLKSISPKGDFMKIENNAVVSIHYVLTDESGQTLDSSAGKDPLTYLHGNGNLIPGLEKELVGKITGDEMDVRIEPGEAYGEVNEELIQQVPRTAFEGVEDIEAGMQFQATGANGEVQRITVIDASDEGVTIDANHPLAGVTLFFNVKIEDIRVATEEEISHGHVHG